jgi:hypothetical protein
MSVKRFSNKIMEVPVTVKVSTGMFKKLRERKNSEGESHSNYIRTLIMNDLNIDYNGNKETHTR